MTKLVDFPTDTRTYLTFDKGLLIARSGHKANKHFQQVGANAY